MAFLKAPSLDPSRRLRRHIFVSWLDYLSVYWLTSLVVFAGVLFALLFMDFKSTVGQPVLGLLEGVSRWDGRRYWQILERGYYYDLARQSNVAFFPLFPLAAGALAGLTGIGVTFSLFLTSHVFLAASFVLLAVYLRGRNHADDRVNFHALLIFGLWPTTFFFRMSYSESTFLFVTLLTLYAMRRQYPTIVIALLAGLATAARPVGVALLLPLADHVWQRTRHAGRFVGRMAYLGPVACWGLIAFMAYQYAAFDEPLAFAKTQALWHDRPLVSPLEKAQALATLEPLWSVYVPSSPAYWRNHARDESAVFSLQFANPLFFVAAAGLLALGAQRRWLSRPELLLSAGLLLIPYVSRSYEMCMASQGRFTAVIFPVYIVLGHLLARAPAWASGVCYAVCAVFLAGYAAHFAAGYFLI